MFGCGGGDTVNAYEQLMGGDTKFGAATSGLASEAMIPYTQSMYDECLGRLCTQGCREAVVGSSDRGFDSNLTLMNEYESLTGPYVAISDYSYATPPCTGACADQDLETLNANVAATAPASICVNAGT